MSIFSWERRKESFRAGGENITGVESFPNPERDRLIRKHLDGVIEEIEKDGRDIVFRFGFFEYPTLKDAALARLHSLETVAPTKPRPEAFAKAQIRQKTREELARELEAALSSLEGELIGRLSEILQRPGEWRNAMITDSAYLRGQAEAQAWTDLKARLREFFGNDLTLFLFSLINPEVFDKALQTLPEGQTEEAVMQEEVAKIAEAQEHRVKEIERTRALLRKLK